MLCTLPGSKFFILHNLIKQHNIMNQYFTGAGVALVTPFSENNKIDFNAFDRIIQNQVQGNTDYLVALGTTAETPTITAHEKEEVVQFVKEKKSGLPLVVGMGG